MALPLISWNTTEVSLRQPMMIVSLDGFVDSAKNARQAANFLRSRWSAKCIATFSSDAFFDYRDRRPGVIVEDGKLRKVNTPRIELWAAQVPDADRDVVFLVGPEPDIQWQTFSHIVCESATKMKVSKVVQLDAFPGMNPHTRSVRLLGVHNTTANELPEDVAMIADYQGPIGAGHFLLSELDRFKIPAWGISAELPPYLAGEQYPAAVLTLVEFIANFLEVEIDTTQLRSNVESIQATIDRVIGDRPGIKELVEQLEKNADEPSNMGVPIPSGDQLAEELQNFMAHANGDPMFDDDSASLYEDFYRQTDFSPEDYDFDVEYDEDIDYPNGSSDDNEPDFNDGEE